MNFRLLLIAGSLLVAQSLCAQGNPRLFLDIPSISVFSPDVANFNDRFGLGLGTAMNVGTHWGMVRAGGGLDMTMEMRNLEEKDAFVFLPYALVEGGVGKFRSNGNRCASHNQSAFTAMPVVGYRYDFEPKSGSAYVGAEFGYFYIRDMFKNQEFFIRGDYYMSEKVAAVRLGFRVFLNLKADRSR